MTVGQISGQNVVADEFRAALHQVPAAVVILTTQLAGRDQAQTVTATAICAGSTEPPSLLISLREDAPFTGALSESGVVAVNFVAQEHHEMVRSFVEAGAAEGFARSQTWTRGTTGAPLLNRSVVSMDCTIIQSQRQGANIVFTGQVQTIHTAEAEGLLYRGGLLRRLETGS
ncbi:flavin reductase family protein [Falsigemmobacter faecalis]|uniref:flavin reductase family protein n=1 Tax=Falsigemmobacter faecalis TaxID=2488730 RepID=UPI0013151EA2|nr:flavin reductase family protein [Falsigemmobacter faecalis]